MKQFKMLFDTIPPSDTWQCGYEGIRFSSGMVAITDGGPVLIYCDMDHLKKQWARYKCRNGKGLNIIYDTDKDWNKWSIR